MSNGDVRFWVVNGAIHMKVVDRIYGDPVELSVEEVRDLANRLLALKPLGSKELKSTAAQRHGQDRRRRGYTAAMMVEESRILQVTIFHTLQKNLGTIDFTVLLLGVMTIADEVDSQLSQAMKSYVAEPFPDPLAA